MEEVVCRSAEEFVGHLLPHNSRWHKPMKQYVFRGQGGDYVEIVKLSIPASASEEVRDILDKYGINYSSIFPDRNGIVQYMKTHYRIPKFV